MKHLGTPTEFRIINNQITKQQDNHQFHRTGQLRRAKLHAAYFIESLDNNRALSPALRRLLEASLILDTTNAKTLATYLKLSPATIRNEFQRIRTILGYIGEFQTTSNTKTQAINKDPASLEK